MTQPSASRRNDLLRATDVVADRIDQRSDGVVADLIPQSSPELDAERLTGQLASSVAQEEGLHVERFDAERGVRPHVERRPVSATSVLGHARVDPLPRKEQARPRPQVGRGVPEIAAAPVAGDDLALQDEPAAEGDGRPVEIARSQGFPDGCRRHGAFLDPLQGNRLGGEPERRTERREGIHRPLSLEAEREIGPHRRVHGVHAAPRAHHGRSRGP